MKKQIDLWLLLVFLLSLPVCVWAWFANIMLILFVTVVPFFCLQLLLCRVTVSRVARAVPVLPVLFTLMLSAFYFIRDSGWDRLGALIFGAAAIAPTVGIALGWAVWWICRVIQKRKQHEGA